MPCKDGGTVGAATPTLWCQIPEIAIVPDTSNTPQRDVGNCISVLLFYLPTYLFVHLSVYLRLSLFIYIYINTYLYMYIHVFMFALLFQKQS